MVMGAPTRRESFFFGLLGSLTAGVFLLWIQMRIAQKSQEEGVAAGVRKITRRSS